VIIPFGEWLPDQADLNNPGSTLVKNVLPHAMGYAPFPSAAVYSDALTAYCRGAFYCRDKSNNVYIYGGDATKIQSIADGAWSDVTRSADPYATGTGERWEFAKWNETVLATNFTDEIQVITMGGANYADLAGTPPHARHMAVARNFVILANINEVGGDGLVPHRVQWSGLNNSVTWATSSVTQADEEDLKGSGGWCQRVFGGEYAVVFQENSIWRMSYVGTPAIWQFDEVAQGTGLIAPDLAAQDGDLIYFLSPSGFMVLQDGSRVEPIGSSKVDRFVLDDIDTAYLDRCSSVVDNKSHRVYFSYPGSGASAGLANKMVVYDYSLGRWSYSEQDTEQLLIAATSGYTLDGLDSYSTDLDSITISLDDPSWTGGRAQLGKIDSAHKLAFFTGSAMSATLETTEIQLTPGRRTMLSTVRPLVDGGSTTIQVAHRNIQSATESWNSAITPNANGRASIRKNARYHRMRANLSGSWTHAQGVEIEGKAMGAR